MMLCKWCRKPIPGFEEWSEGDKAIYTSKDGVEHEVVMLPSPCNPCRDKFGDVLPRD